MSKIKTAFFCQNCGYESAKWLGKCPNCGEWNTFMEEVIQKEKPGKQAWEEQKTAYDKAVRLDELEHRTEERIVTPDNELNRVLGGGIVAGSLVLIAGEPGIGKSTLFLQTALQMKSQKILYISGEESSQQIKMRAARLGYQNEQFYLLTEVDMTAIFKVVKKLQPELIIVDSVQTLQSAQIDSAPGSVAQIRECAGEWQRFSKVTGIPVMLIGHITKEGMIAGPKILEHMVDTVLQFEGDRHYMYRILRTIKNRFGATAELGIYEMSGNGLQPVSNPSAILINEQEEQLSGIAIAATMEGLRPMLIEIQALVTQSVYGTPQRTVSGYDLRRVQLLLAVLEKRGGFHFGMKDVFLNIAGGLKVEDPAADLAVIAALLSSYEDVSLPKNICFAGEVGLSGEIRAVNRIEQRIAEAEKLGMEKIFISRNNKKAVGDGKYQQQIVLLNTVEELYRQLF